MGISINNGSDEDDVVAAINTTPLVDVMLVLLIIFLITIPVVTHSVPVDLPKERSQPRSVKVETVNLAIDRTGKVYWNERSVRDEAALINDLQQLAAQQASAEVQIRGDGAVPYEAVGRVLAAARRAGINKVGLVTEPPPRP